MGVTVDKPMVMTFLLRNIEGRKYAKKGFIIQELIKATFRLLDQILDEKLYIFSRYLLNFSQSIT